MVWWIREPEPSPAPVTDERMWSAVTSGLRFIATNPVLRALALHAASMGFFMGFFAALYILFAMRELHISPAGLGAVVMMGGAGATVGALLAPVISARLGIGPSLMLGAAIVAAATSLIPLAHGTPFVAGLFLAGAQLGDLGFPLYSINEITLRQSVAPAETLGRINAGMQFALRGLLPIGSLCGGVIAQVAGVRTALVISGAGLFGALLWLWFSPVRKLRTLPLTVPEVHQPAKAE